MALKLFFGARSSNEGKESGPSFKRDSSASLKLVTDREVYRPGDSVIATVEICNQASPAGERASILVDNLGFEVKGIEKLDPQWFSTQKPPPGSKQRRGEHFFLDCSTPIVSKVVISSGSTRTYTVRVELPKILPPSYKGTSIRYSYHLRTTLQGRWLVLENDHHGEWSKDDFIQLDARCPLQIWVTQNNNNLSNEDMESSPKRLNNSSSAHFSNLERKMSGSSYTDKGDSQPAPTSSEGFFRGRSYNIRIDDQVLLRFSPRNSDSSYYFGDTIGGTLTFFHEEGASRCLEVSVTLETSENINQHVVHPSRRSTLTITKVQSDHHEVVADLVQTSFLFSIPVDGPMSFSTPYISVKWALRFEFFTTPKQVDLTKYSHPLLIEEREKGEWVLPITVYAPPPRALPVNGRNENSSLGGLWVRT